MQTKIAVIGDRASILGFKAAGFDVFEASDGVSFAGLVDSLAVKGYGIIFIMEELMTADFEVAEKYKNDMLPAIIAIPGHSGSYGIGMDGIRKNVERAAGADIFNN
ncbi:MAG: V-type ATP synthase subunit F [Bacillota bacterium]|nr:V-type ATP synthase subunit F [Bacillota bacterium]